MRRLAFTTIVLMTLLLATVVTAPGVSAQAPAEHPAIGAWIVDGTEVAVVAPGSVEGSAYGSWAATGERSADVTSLWPLSDPEAGFIGFGILRASIEVAEDGQSFTGTYTMELPAGMAEAMGVPVGQLGPGDVTGQRIAVEPMGTPVGPMPAEEPVE
jgi:hypothetical protein